MYNPNQIADFFLSKTDAQKGDTISPLKLQKLIYYAQAWHYTIFGAALFDEKIEAWVNGPVVRSVYDRFSGITKNASIVIDYPNLDIPHFEEKTQVLLNEVYQIYGERTGAYLENLTHSEMPWIIARGGVLPYMASNKEITLESMKEFYSTFKHEE
jgi:uncharacterized phage-associated protein